MVKWKHLSKKWLAWERVKSWQFSSKKFF